MKLEVRVPAENEGVSGSRGSRKVKVVGKASAKKGLPGGGRGTGRAAVLRANLLRCWGARVQGRAVVLGCCRLGACPAAILGLVRPRVLIFEWENMLPAVLVRVSAGNRWYAQTG